MNEKTIVSLAGLASPADAVQWREASVRDSPLIGVVAEVRGASQPVALRLDTAKGVFLDRPPHMAVDWSEAASRIIDRVTNRTTANSKTSNDELRSALHVEA